MPALPDHRRFVGPLRTIHGVTDSSARVESAPRSLLGLLARVGSLADLPADDADTRVLKRAVTLTSFVVIGVTFGWVLIGLASGSLLIVATSVLFAVVVAADLVYLGRRKAFPRFAAVLMVSSIGVVLVGYATVGGSIAGGTDLGWGFLAPIGAVVLYGPRRSIPWFFAFLALVAVALLIDPLIRPLGTPPPYPFSLFLIGFNVMGPGAIAYLLLRYIDAQRVEARAQSDRLLLNILPPSVAERLKAGDQHVAELCPEASVLFADVADFTPLIERTSPQAMIDLLTALFTMFDELADRYGLEKIKTVGDAYTAAAGVPEPRRDHALAAVQMAIAMAAAARRVESVDRSRAAPAGGNRNRSSHRRRHRAPEVRLRPVGRYRQRRQPHGVSG
jgi:adenylate cyclase